MIEKLEMHLPNYEVHISTDDALINGIKVDVNDEIIKDIIRIMRTWKPEYKNNNGIDKEKYYIYLKTSKEETTFSFISSFPDNFYQLTNCLGDLYVGKQI